MATYTAVLVTANELEQDDVIGLLEKVGIVVFCGPGSLVSEDADVGGDAASEPASEVTVGLDGLMARVTVSRTADGPRVELQGINCNLEGEMPGEYYLTPMGDTLSS